MMSYKELKLISQYITAINREYHLTTFNSKYFDLPLNICILPNVYIFQKKIKRNIQFSIFLITIIRLLWIFGLSYLYFFSISFVGLLKKKDSRYEDIKEIYLASSDDRNMNSIYSQYNNVPNIVLIPSLKKHELSEWMFANDCKITSIYNICSFKEIVSSIKLSIRVVTLLNSKHTHLQLYTYSAINWLLTYIVIQNRNINSIWLSNHYDRWASLACTLSNKKITMVQHGNLCQFNTKSNKLHIFKNLPMFKFINTVYYNEKNGTNLFLKFVVQNVGTFKHFKSNLKLLELNEDKRKKSVLIIGNPTLYEEISSIIYIIQNNINIDCIYYRPHPRENSSMLKYLLKFNKVIVTNSKISIPPIQYLITYGSSLDLEVQEITNCLILTYSPNNSAFVEYLSNLKNIV